MSGKLQPGVTFRSFQPSVNAALLDGYRRNLQKGALIWERAIKRRLQGQRTGLEYRVPGTQRFYTASAPGESPARRFGGLASSYTNEVSATSIFALNAFVGSDLDYSLFLERGTKNPDGSVRMEKRPTIEPALRDAEAEIRAALSEPVE